MEDSSGVGIVPLDPTVVLQIPSLHDPSPAPAGAAPRRVRNVVPDRGWLK